MKIKFTWNDNLLVHQIDVEFRWATTVFLWDCESSSTIKFKSINRMSDAINNLTSSVSFSELNSQGRMEREGKK